MKYLKIITVLVGAFMISKLLIKDVFIANSPTIRSDAIQYISLRVSNLIPGNSAFFSKSPREELKNTPFSLVSKGVYAKSSEKSSYTKVSIDEVDWIEYTFNVDGKTIKIRVPKGQPGPQQKDAEELQ